jgi:hypothetical protein
VRDRGAERALCGPLGVGVDPVVVAGCLGEEVDLFLRDLVPSLYPLCSPTAARSASTDSKTFIPAPPLAIRTISIGFVTGESIERAFVGLIRVSALAGSAP